MYNYNNQTNDPQQEMNEQENECCPSCGSTNYEFSHYSSFNGNSYSVCLECDEIFKTY